jgi:acyl-CoA thioester hydrolase
MTDRQFDLTDPTIYTFWMTDRVRFSDQDGSGHINNVAIAAYVETGRVSYMHEVVLPELRDETRLIIARLAIDYLKEAHWPGEVRVGTRMIRLGTRSCTIGSGIFKDDHCIATAQSVAVYLQGEQSLAIAGAMRERVAALVKA